jgi:serine/threonine-protein kinase
MIPSIIEVNTVVALAPFSNAYTLERVNLCVRIVAVASELLEELREALREQYAVESEVGRGGMATVFLAEDLKHGRRVAIKVLSPELSSSMDGDRFKREIQIAARLSHPHILPVFDSGQANGLLYYVMPFVEGESLRGRLKRETQLSIEDAVTLTCEVADALSYAHSFGVVHRDIKPENILLHGGHAVVADFGIARVIQDAGGEKLTQTGMSVGTAAYMSPEQFSGENVDGRSDMYSLACVLYEMLVGEVPFTGPNAIAIMARHTMELPPSIQIVRGTVPDELEGAIMHALEKVPADRFATVAQFKDAVLGQGATSTYARRTRAYTRQHPVAGWSPVQRRRRTLAYGVIVIALLAMGSLAARYYWIGKSRHSMAGDLDLRRIAVRYLENATNDSMLAHVADGLTESLISQLSQVEGLNVVSASGVAPFRSAEIADDSVARVLKAGVLVHGSIDQTAKLLRVSISLVDGQSGASIQRASFAVTKGDFLRARDSLASTVADLLRRRLGEEVRLREQQNSTSSVEAWTLVQRAQNASRDAERLIAAGDPQSAQQRLVAADSLAGLAARADPRWPEPLVTRAAVAYRQARLARESAKTTDFIQQGVVLAEQALAIDSLEPSALELRGTLQYFRIAKGFVPNQSEAKQIIVNAERDLREAVRIAPRQASAWYALSVLQYSKQDVPESYLYAQKAYEADAFLRAAPDIVWRLYATSYDMEQFPNAAKWCSEGLSRFPRDPRFTLCQLHLMLTKAVEPKPAEAWRVASELTKVTPQQDTAMQRRLGQILVAIVIGRAGLRDSAHHVLERSRAGIDIDPRGELIGYEALARTFLGEREEAISLLERYLTAHPEHRAGFAKVNAWWWRDLQKDPRFKTVAGMGR